MTPDEIEKDRALERIWAEAPGVLDDMGFWQPNQSAGLEAYVRADLFDAVTQERDAALALVAAAYEAAAQVAADWGDGFAQKNNHYGAAATRVAAIIRRMLPADALAAQAARDERMRAEGMATAYAKAQQAIADLPYPKDEAAVNEQENCYRAVEALATLEKHHE